MKVASNTIQQHKHSQIILVNNWTSELRICWFDGCGYSPHEFSNSNCTRSLGIYGVWKANKFWSGCTKFLSMEFRILTEYFFFSSLILWNAWYFVYICKRIYVTLSLIQHGMHSHSITHISLADAELRIWFDGCGYGPREFSNSNCTRSLGIYRVWKANKFWSGCTKCLSMEFRILTEYFFSVPLYAVMHGTFFIYVTLSLIQHRMHSHSISHISFADAMKIQ